MTKSLFENKNGESIFKRKDGLNNDNSPPQVFVNGKDANEKDMFMSGAFFLKEEELIADIRLEFNVKHPKYGEYIKRLKNFVKECEDEHILLSSSGI